MPCSGEATQPSTTASDSVSCATPVRVTCELPSTSEYDDNKHGPEPAEVERASVETQKGSGKDSMKANEEESSGNMDVSSRDNVKTQASSEVLKGEEDEEDKAPRKRARTAEDSDLEAQKSTEVPCQGQEMETMDAEKSSATENTSKMKKEATEPILGGDQKTDVKKNVSEASGKDSNFQPEESKEVSIIPNQNPVIDRTPSIDLSACTSLEEALIKVQSFAESTPSLREDKDLLQYVQKLCATLGAADRSCQEELRNEPLAEVEHDEERPRRVNFATTTLLPLTTPNIGIQGSEEAWFKTLQNLHEAHRAANDLRSYLKQSETAKELIKITLLDSIEGQASTYGTLPGDVVRNVFTEICTDVPCEAIEAPLRELVESANRYILRKIFNVPVTCEMVDDENDEPGEVSMGMGTEIIKVKEDDSTSDTTSVSTQAKAAFSASRQESAEAAPTLQSTPPQHTEGKVRVDSDGDDEMLEEATETKMEAVEADENELEAIAGAENLLPRPRPTQLVFGGDCGSYQFNSEDAAAVLRDALEVWYHCRSEAEAWKTWYAAKEPSPEEAPDLDLDRLKLYPRAHAFLDRTFVQDAAMIEALKQETALLEQMEECGEVAREIGLDEELAYLPITKPEQMVEDLNRQKELASSLQTWLDDHHAALNPRSMRSRPRRCRMVIEPGHVDGGEFRFPVLLRRTMSALCPKCMTMVEDRFRGGEICCDRCGRWYHLKCLRLPQRYGQTVESFTCPSCIPSNMI